MLLQAEARQGISVYCNQKRQEDMTEAAMDVFAFVILLYDCFVISACHFVEMAENLLTPPIM